MKKILTLFFIGLSFGAYSQTNDSSFSVKQINIQGNKKTKDFIILRELTFKAGDKVQNWNEQMEQSRKQLINLFLFNEILITKNDSGMVTIHVTERWYFWPIPMVQLGDRNFNQWWLTKDPARLIYGIQLRMFNLRGRNETMLVDFKTGYTQLFNISYKVPYFNKRNTWGVQLSFGISANREVWYKTENDKVQFFRDNDLFLINRRNVELNFTHRKKFFHYHQVYGGYRYTGIKDTIYSNEVNSNFLYKAGRNFQEEYYIGYQFTYDRRDFKGYPTKGEYLKASIEGPYFIEKNTGVFPVRIKVTAAKYMQIHKNLFAAIGGTARLFEIDKLPYNRTQALGYGKDFIRGYELNVIDGRHFLLGKSELKFRLINRKYDFMKKVRNYEKLPLALFLTTYYDAGYVWNSDEAVKLTNKMPDSYQYGTGVGLNLVMFYDYCMRMEYSINKYQQHRLYVQFVASI